MAKSLIQTVNESVQNVVAGGIVNPGTTIRRFGCNLRLSGNAIEVMGDGYYTLDAALSVTPTAAGPVTVALYDEGVQIPGAVSYATGAAGDPISVNVPPCTIRKGCGCSGSGSITLVLVEGAGEVNNAAIRIEKM